MEIHRDKAKRPHAPPAMPGGFRGWYPAREAAGRRPLPLEGWPPPSRRYRDKVPAVPRSGRRLMKAMGIWVSADCRSGTFALMRAEGLRTRHLRLDTVPGMISGPPLPARFAEVPGCPQRFVSDSGGRAVLPWQRRLSHISSSLEIRSSNSRQGRAVALVASHISQGWTGPSSPQILIRLKTGSGILRMTAMTRRQTGRT